MQLEMELWHIMLKYVHLFEEKLPQNCQKVPTLAIIGTFKRMTFYEKEVGS